MRINVACPSTDVCRDNLPRQGKGSSKAGGIKTGAASGTTFSGLKKPAVASAKPSVPTAKPTLSTKPSLRKVRRCVCAAKNELTFLRGCIRYNTKNELVFFFVASWRTMWVTVVPKPAVALSACFPCIHCDPCFKPETTCVVFCMFTSFHRLHLHCVPFYVRQLYA